MALGGISLKGGTFRTPLTPQKSKRQPPMWLPRGGSLFDCADGCRNRQGLTPRTNYSMTDTESTVMVGFSAPSAMVAVTFTFLPTN